MAESNPATEAGAELKLSPEAEGLREQHPLLRTYDLLRSRSDHYRLLVDDPEGEGWVTLNAMLELDTGVLVRLVDQQAAHHKVKGRSASAVLFFSEYAYVAIAMCAATYLSFQRVPLLATGDVVVRYDEDSHIAGVAVRSYRFAALPGDPDANHPDCVVAATPDALRDRLREQLIAHLEPLVLAIHAATRAGKPALWAIAQDYAASAFSWIGKTLGEQQSGISESLLIAEPPSKLHRDKGFVHIEHCGQEYYMVDRLSCCLYYKSPEGHYCSSCPHRPMEERVDIIKNWLATLAQPESTQPESTQPEVNQAELALAEEGNA